MLRNGNRQMKTQCLKLGYGMILLLNLTQLLSACEQQVGAPGPGQLKSRSNVAAPRLANGELPVQVDNKVQLYNSPLCPYSSSQPNLNSDQMVSISMAGCATALYGIAMGAKLWVNREALYLDNNGLIITFKQKPDSSFHLARIYNELNNTEVVGHIEQVDTSQCDALIASGQAVKGSSCTINFAYLGDALNKASNVIHFIFSENNQQQLDFPVKAYNDITTYQVRPILQPFSSPTYINYLFNSTSENLNHTDLNYSINYGITVTNVGDEALQAPDSTAPDILLTLGSKMGVNTTTNALYANNQYYTNCYNLPAQPGQVCTAAFYDKLLLASTDINSTIGRFNFYYFPSANYIELTQPFAIGVGDIANRDYQLNVAASSKIALNFDLEKINYGNESAPLIYGISLSNFKLSVKYQPNFFIATSHNKQTLEYGYGDYANLPAAAMPNKIQFHFDDCFSAAFNRDGINQIGDSTQKCHVGVTLDDDLRHLITTLKKPLGVQIYADYDTPINSKHISQLVGNLILQADEFTPAGDYQTVFHDISFDGELLSGWQTANHQFGEYSELDYYHTCAPDSSVGVLWSVTPYPAKPIALMQCNQLADNFPPGTYSQSCVSLTYDGRVLTGSCLQDLGSGGHPLQHSVLDYANQCSVGSSVVNNQGSLACTKTK